jgi:hypothetical protein
VESDNRPTLFDPVRRRYVLATPEEGVRQAVLRYLIDILRVPVNLIGVEFSLTTIDPGNLRRVDIVVWRPGQNLLTPWLLVECKAKGININDEVAFQAADYLRKIPCQFVMLTNGSVNRYLQRDGENYSLVPGIPYFNAKIFEG